MQMPKREGWYLCELSRDSFWRGALNRPFAVCRARMMRDARGTLSMMWEGMTIESVVAWYVLPKETVKRARQ